MDPRLRTIRFWLLAVLWLVLVVCRCDMALLAAYSLSPLGLMMPVFASAPTCGTSTCTTAFSAQYQIVISGFTNNTCTTCTSRNSTWTVTTLAYTLIDGGVSTDCYAHYVINPCLCTGSGGGEDDDERYAINELLLTAAGGGPQLTQVQFRWNVIGSDCHTVAAGGQTGDTIWAVNGTQACGSLSSLEVPYLAYSNTGCTFDHSSAYVTSL